jgi:hypothetical protein
MARCRSVMGLGLLAVWLAIPALACLPNSQMTAAEMACCKKMAGDCQMGSGQHPCCKTIANRPQQVAATQPISQILPSVAVVAEVATDPVPSTLTAAAETHVGLGLPPPAPPGLHSILRI